MHRTFEEGLAECCAALGPRLLPWSALAGGALSGKYLGGALPEGSRLALFPVRYARFASPRVMAAAAEYADIAAGAGLTPAQLGLAFCRSRWFVGSTLVGASSVHQLASNLAAFQSPLSPETLAAVDAVHLRHRNPALVD